MFKISSVQSTPEDLLFGSAEIISHPSSIDQDKFPINLGLLDSIRKQPVVHRTELDFLTLSCTIFRLKKENVGYYLLNDARLIPYVQPEDQILAGRIIEYYSKKIMMAKLLDIKLSKFKEDLNIFIHSNRKQITEEWLGLVIKLPEFYEYDIRFEKILEPYNYKNIDNINGYNSKSLDFIDITTRNRLSKKQTEFWFKDEKNFVVSICLDSTNPLLKIWEQIVRSKDVGLTIYGFFTKKSRDGHEFYLVDKYELG